MSLALFLSILPLIEGFFVLPFELRLQQGENQSLALNLPFSITIKGDQSGIIKLNGENLSGKSISLQPGSSWQVEPLKQGEVNLQVKLLGIIPLKKVRVNVVNPTKVIPAGSSIGILLRSEGVIVVGFSSVVDSYGRLHYPAREIGVVLGDLIRKVNGRTIHSTEDIIQAIEVTGSNNDYLTMEIKRKNNIFIKKVKPIFCRETKKYRIGLYVIDNTEGVGTLTFYNPKNKKYGALGHIITENSTNTKMIVGEGNIVEVDISAIEKGKRGRPGEKVGSFSVGRDKIIGNIEKNTILGIYGCLDKSPKYSYYKRPISVALVNQVKEGPAEILTVLEGKKIEKFTVIIEKVIQQEKPSDKGLIIRVTDKRLLKTTGGIIQGMSGSPVIQNGKLVGAVTHVFVNDPTRGYGVLAEWMVKEAS